MNNSLPPVRDNTSHPSARLDDPPSSYVEVLRRRDINRLAALPCCQEIADLSELRRFINKESNYFAIENMSDLEFHRLLNALGRLVPPDYLTSV